MASLKPVIRLSQVKIDKKCNIKIRICHERKVSYIKTPYSIEPKYMKPDGTISNKYPGQAKLNLAINLLMAEYNGVLEGIGKDIVYMDVNTIVKKLRRHQDSGEGIIRYMNERIRTLKDEGRLSYATTYEATIKHLQTFAGKDEVLFKEINLDFLNRFERQLLKDLKINTVRIYLNNIRAVFNHAIDNDIIKLELFPFRKFKVKQEKTIKRNLTPDEIKKLLSLNLSPARQRALDLWMLSFYLSGINFKDMLFLTSKNVSKGRIDYVRAKTGQRLSIKITPEAERIINKYRGEQYLLCFADGINLKRKTAGYKDIIRDTNLLLKKICKDQKLDIPLSTYYARHSVASIAYSLKINEDVISEMLGHKHGSQMTDVYIKRDFTRIDEAQRMVIDSLI